MPIRYKQLLSFAHGSHADTKEVVLTHFSTEDIVGVRIAASSYRQTLDTILTWARRSESRTVIFANVHVVMEAKDSPQFRMQLNAADLINPDGVPLVWALRALGKKHATRVYGPDTTEMLLQAAEVSDVPVGFYGSSEETLRKLLGEVRNRHPSLRVVFSMSPPFRNLADDEDENVVKQISESGARLLFVGLGCPKQERWVMEHRGRIPAVMLAVGAAFDFIAGSKPQAPRWMMKSGTEWVFRLFSEPRRLAGRYMKHNPRFVLFFLKQWIGRR